ncbi:hypothetical protein JB92DRAFT_2831202 [Gautieria morchelliformis]|nr:hypothetical protein JB92DRAFT_2831202 [Gautieria morchelliformis]
MLLSPCPSLLLCPSLPLPLCPCPLLSISPAQTPAFFLWNSFYIIWPLTLKGNLLDINYLPAGPTSILFSILYQFYRLVPSAYTFWIFALKVSNKSFLYILALQAKEGKGPAAAAAKGKGKVAVALFVYEDSGLVITRVPLFLAYLWYCARRQSQASGSEADVDDEDREENLGRLVHFIPVPTATPPASLAASVPEETVGRTYHIAKRPGFPNTSVLRLINEFGATEFIPALTPFLRFYLPSFMLRSLQQIDDTVIKDVIQPTPRVPRRGRTPEVPEHFNTVLIHYGMNAQETGALGYRVGRVWTIFGLPSHIEYPHPLVFLMISSMTLKFGEVQFNSSVSDRKASFHGGGAPGGPSYRRCQATIASWARNGVYSVQGWGYGVIHTL